MTDEGKRLGPTREETRLQSEYAEVFHASPDGILIADMKGVILDLNPSLARMFGYSTEELLGCHLEILVPEAHRDEHSAHRSEYAKNPQVRSMGARVDLLGLRKDGSDFPAEISLSPLQDQETPRVIATVRDVSDRRELQAFGAGAIRAAENERARIARELHDDTAQRLAAALLRLRTVAEEGDAQKRAGLTAQLRMELQETADGVRRIARGLRPPALEEVGMEAALRAHIRGLADQFGMEVSFHTDKIDDLIGAEQKLALYRIVQEALSNVVRHSETQRAEVTIERIESAVRVEVRDEGRGFDPNWSAHSGGGLGLIGMRERAAGSGGRAEVFSSPGKGTRVVAEFPKSNEKSDG